MDELKIKKKKLDQSVQSLTRECESMEDKADKARSVTMFQKAYA